MPCEHSKTQPEMGCPSCFKYLCEEVERLKIDVESLKRKLEKR